MPPKKKDKKDESNEKKETFAEVDRVFLELELAESNKKVARLKLAVEDYERRNEELQNEYNKLDEDRADIIAYLKKTLNVKNDENNELKEKVRGLEELREIETKEFNEKTEELQKNFTIMKDQLTSENKLLSGKMNTLEEFRAIRDDLMRKFDRQEQDFKDQEMKYKRLIYDAEKKFIIGKDKLKKEMEARLLQLAQDFQDATELRIAASTHRVIRENIAINNELDTLLANQTKLGEQNERYKENERVAKLALQVAEEERDKAIDRNIVQLKVIDKLTKAYEDIKYQRALYQKQTYDFESLSKKIEKLTKENEKLLFQVRVLEQHLHADMSDKNVFNLEINKLQKETDKLRNVLQQAAVAIKASLKLDQWAEEDSSREIEDRQSLLNHLLDIICKYKERERADSMDTLATFTNVYEEGDLGFVPKPEKSKSRSSAASEALTSRERLLEEAERESSKEETISSIGSFSTIPAMHVLPPKETPAAKKIPSLPSLVSSKSGASKASTVEPEEVTGEEAGEEKPTEEKTPSKVDVAKVASGEHVAVGEEVIGEEVAGEHAPGEEIGGEHVAGEEVTGEHVPGEEIVGEEGGGEGGEETEGGHEEIIEKEASAEKPTVEEPHDEEPAPEEQPNEEPPTE